MRAPLRGFDRDARSSISLVLDVSVVAVIISANGDDISKHDTYLPARCG